MLQFTDFSVTFLAPFLALVTFIGSFYGLEQSYFQE
jgi:hypothetical protein